MKHLVLIITFCTLFLGAKAQETIELDGVKIKKSILKPGREVKLNAKEYKTNGKHGVDSMHKNKQPLSVKAAVPRNKKAYGLSINYDFHNTELPSSNLKFFDEKGNKKWEKRLQGRSPAYSRISNDGRYWIINMINHRYELLESSNSLVIYNNDGTIVFKDDSIAKMSIAESNNMVTYQRKTEINNYADTIKEFYCYNIKSHIGWKKTHNQKVEVRPVSLNGDYIIAYSNHNYSLYNRNGKELFHKPASVFGGGISKISNDGKYAICNRSSAIDTSYYLIYNLKTLKGKRTNYFKVPEIKTVVNKGYNGASFVNRSKYIVALTSIIAPYTAMIVFHDLDGTYLGHKVYNDIKSSFWGPNITLQNDGSFEVCVDGYYLGNLRLPNVNTLKYLKK